MLLALAFITLSLFPTCSMADTSDTWALRCGNYSVQLGDSEMYVRRVCREPTASDTEWTTLRGSQPVYWYNRGKGDFIYRLSFDDGVLFRIQMMERGFR